MIVTPVPTPAQTPRSPMATGTPEQKARYDALSLLRPKDASMEDALDGAHWIITGELPDDIEEDAS